MSTPILYWVEISPWSEKACWALDFHKLPYKKVEYLVWIMAPMLKLKTLTKRKFTDKVTVPVLVDGKEVYTDSFDIAQYAENKANSEQLIPKAHYERIKRLDALSQRLLNVLRAQVFLKIRANYGAKAEKLSQLEVPEIMHGALMRMTDFFTDFLIKKYPTDESESAFSLLEEIRTAIDDRPYVLDEFSYADITLAQPLQFVTPLPNQYINLGVQQRKTMEDTELAKEFEDLIDWRDRLYEKHRN